MFDWIQACFCLQNEPEPASRGLANLHIHCLGLLPFKQKSGFVIYCGFGYFKWFWWLKPNFHPILEIFFTHLSLLYMAKTVAHQKKQHRSLYLPRFQMPTKGAEDKNPRMEEGWCRIHKSIPLENNLTHSEKSCHESRTKWLLLMTGPLESYTASLFAKQVRRWFSNPAEHHITLEALFLNLLLWEFWFEKSRVESVCSQSPPEWFWTSTNFETLPGQFHLLLCLSSPLQISSSLLILGCETAVVVLV